MDLGRIRRVLVDVPATLPAEREPAPAPSNAPPPAEPEPAREPAPSEP